MGNIWLVLLATGTANPRHVRDVVSAVIRAIGDFRADRLFTEIDPGAYLASAVTGVPLASTYAHVATYGRGTLPWRLARRAIGRVLRGYGKKPLTPDELCFNGSVLTIIPSIPELEDTDPGRSDVRFVGSLLSPVHAPPTTEFKLEKGRRYVFVYTGTGSISLTTVQRILPRVFPEGGRVRCVVGGQSIGKSFRLGAVEFHPYVPADEVIPLCDWTICHGGQNTIAQSLAAGVPLIIFPGAVFERRYNARKIEETGAGRMGEVNEFTLERLGTLLQGREECAARASELGRRIHACGGAATAVEAIEKWDREAAAAGRAIMNKPEQRQ